ncbi:hypothetical protein F4780DRAFT_131221 [Xylariomycetidae sp. FL0641]|nr:hypothetical protein F4780DRAFT_131221 [Xylariomycetidae sp. FL0641]
MSRPYNAKYNTRSLQDCVLGEPVLLPGLFCFALLFLSLPSVHSDGLWAWQGEVGPREPRGVHGWWQSAEDGETLGMYIIRFRDTRGRLIDMMAIYSLKITTVPSLK